MNIPKKLQERFGKLVPEGDLCDDCKYLLHFAKGWAYRMGYNEYANNLPVRNKKEVIMFLKDAERVKNL